MCHNIQDYDKKVYFKGNIFSDIKLFVFSQWFQTNSHNLKTLGQEIEMNYTLS